MTTTTKTRKGTKKVPYTATAPVEKPKVDFHELLNEALTMPGSLGNTYNRFKVGAGGNGYSFMNQVWLWAQGVTEPCAPYGIWKKLGRHPKTGGAKWLLHPSPLTFEKENPKTGEVEKVTIMRFIPKRTTFPYSETMGEELEWPELPAWNLDWTLENLEIAKVDYHLLDGNTQGYSLGKEYAINPVAVYPWKTTFHELAHIVLGHTEESKLGEYQEHRGIMEFQAEAVAYLVAHELELTDWAAEESRAYIQHWLGGTEVKEAHIRQVFGAATKIIDAGRTKPGTTTTEEE